MLKAALLRLHRWVAVIFALPIAIVAITGFILAFEPIVDAASVRPGSLSADTLSSLVAKYDPDGKARGFSVDTRQNVMTLRGVGEDGSLDVDIASGQETDASGALDDVFSTARRLHQRLVFGLRPLVIASSFAMLALAVVGLLMGFSRLRNTMSGWHKAVAWVLFPLIVLSPLTGVFLAFNVNLGSGAPEGAGRGQARTPRVAAERLTLAQATRIAAAKIDPASIISVGVRGGRMLALAVEGGETQAYAITKDGVTAQPRNWSRALHVGAGVWTGLLNVIASLAIVMLLVTGLTIWARRTFRRRNRRRGAAPAGAPARA